MLHYRRVDADNHNPHLQTQFSWATFQSEVVLEAILQALSTCDFRRTQIDGQISGPQLRLRDVAAQNTQPSSPTWLSEKLSSSNLE